MAVDNCSVIVVLVIDDGWQDIISPARMPSFYIMEYRGRYDGRHEFYSAWFAGLDSNTMLELVCSTRSVLPRIECDASRYDLR